MTMSFNNNKMCPVRALLAILIVLGHFSFFDVTWLMPMRFFAPISVAFFLFISGFGLTRSVREKGKQYLQTFLPSKLVRIVLPAVLVVLLHLLLCGGSGIGLSGRLRLVFSCGNTLLPHFWFVWVILFDYLLFYLSFRFLRGTAPRYAILVGSLALLLATWASDFDQCWWMCTLAFPAGAFYSDFEESIYSFCSRSERAYGFALFLLLLIGVGIYLIPFPLTQAVAYGIFPSILALCVARLPIDRWHLPVLAFIGGISYELYLIHITMMSFFRGDTIRIDSDIIYVLSVLALSIGVAWLLHLICTPFLRVIRK